MSITGPTGVLADWFSSAIECTKEQSANTVVILKAWISVKGSKVVKNVFKIFYS